MCRLVLSGVMAGVFAVVGWRFGVSITAIPPMVAAVSLTTLAAVDLRTYRLPDVLVLPATGGSVAAVALVSLGAGRPDALVAALVAALAYGGFMLTVHEISPASLGFGDVKLSPLLGLNVGWVAWMHGHTWNAVVGLVLQALLLSSLLGVVMGLSLVWLRRKGRQVLADPEQALSEPSGSRGVRQTAFPFAPALAAGTIVAMLLVQAPVLPPSIV